MVNVWFVDYSLMCLFKRRNLATFLHEEKGFIVRLELFLGNSFVQHHLHQAELLWVGVLEEEWMVENS